MTNIYYFPSQSKEELEEASLKDQDTSSNDSKSSSRENTKTSINALTDSAEKSEEVMSPTKHRISGGIQALMSKLNLVKTDNSHKDNMISPLDIDMYCNSNTGKGGSSWDWNSIKYIGV